MDSRIEKAFNADRVRCLLCLYEFAEKLWDAEEVGPYFFSRLSTLMTIEAEHQNPKWAQQIAPDNLAIFEMIEEEKKVCDGRKEVPEILKLIVNSLGKKISFKEIIKIADYLANVIVRFTEGIPCNTTEEEEMAKLKQCTEKCYVGYDFDRCVVECTYSNYVMFLWLRRQLWTDFDRVENDHFERVLDEFPTGFERTVVESPFTSALIAALADLGVKKGKKVVKRAFFHCQKSGFGSSDPRLAKSLFSFS